MKKFISKKSGSLILSSLALLSFGLLATGCEKKQTESNEILIGSYCGLTGGSATFGISNSNGILLAVEQINKAGGVLGKQIKVITEDDQGKPEESQVVVTKLITRDRVVAVLGQFTSSNSLAGGPVAQANRIPMLSPGSTNPKVTEVGDYIFRACFIDPFQGKVLAKFAMDSLKLKKVAVLRDIKSDYSVGLANFFVEAFTAMGGEIVDDQSYAAGDNDFTAQLTALKAKNPQGLYVPGYYTEVGLIARQAKKLGITVPFMGGDGFDSPKLFEIGGDAVNGSFFSNHYSVDDPDSAVQAFNSAYKAKYNQSPDAMAALGFDAARLMVDAIARAGKAEPSAIRDALKATKGFKGITGEITFDEFRNPTKAAVILKMEDGKQVFVKRVDP